MPHLASRPQTSALPGVVRDMQAASARRRRPWKWLGLILPVVLVLLPGMLALPPVWQVAVRIYLTSQASARGYALTIDCITGGPFSTTELAGVRLRARGGESAGTDLTIRQARFAIDWKIPGLARSAPWLREIELADLSGNFDLAAEMPRTGPREKGRPAAAWWLPASFTVQTGNFQLRQGDYRLRVTQARVSGRPDAPGEIVASGACAEGRGFQGSPRDWRGQTYWKENRLTLVGLDLGDGNLLTSATLDASRLGRRRLDWDCRFTAFGGEVRSQGSLDFARGKPTMEIAATLRHTEIAPLAAVLGYSGTVDGRLDEASFTFRGIPEDLASAQMWISARASGLGLDNCRWESLDAQAVVINHRVQLHRFDLRGDDNRVSLAGDYPLASDNWTDLQAATVRNLNAILRVESGALYSDRSAQGPSGYLLAK